MTAWTSEEVAKVGDAEELDIASLQPDGTLGRFVTIWVVRTGDDLFVRSVNGRSGTWFRGALAAGEGRIRAGDIERYVAFEEADPVIYAAVTAAYHEKYDHYGPSIVGTVVSREAERSILRLVPR
jgi:hypothetical protein